MDDNSLSTIDRKNKTITFIYLYKLRKSKKLIAQFSLEIPIPVAKFRVGNGLAHLF